jgi:hypothetical protein
MHRYSAQLPATVSLTGTTVRTVMQLVTPATRWARVLEFGVSFKSITSTEVAALVEVIRQTSVGTTGASVTPRPINPAHPAALCTVAITFSGTEPTDSGELLFSTLVPVQGGVLVYQPMPGEWWESKESTRIGFRITPPQTQSVMFGIKYEE